MCCVYKWLSLTVNVVRSLEPLSVIVVALVCFGNVFPILPLVVFKCKFLEIRNRWRERSQILDGGFHRLGSKVMAVAVS